MTTIAYRDGVLAADSQYTTTSGIVIHSDMPKLRRLIDGSLLGLAGSSGYDHLLIEWLALHAEWSKRPSFPDGVDVYGVMITPDGRIVNICNLGITHIDAPFIAIGSGNEIALGAMAMGATAEQAVEIAIKYDIYSGGRITTLALSAPRPTRRRR